MHWLSTALFSLFSFNTTEWYQDSSNYWPFENVVRRSVKDYRRGNDGKISGDFQTIPGIVGSALALSGKQAWVDFGKLQSSCLSDPGSCSSGFTVAFWLRLPSFQANKIILQQGRHRHSRGFTVWTRGGEQNKVGVSVNTRAKKYGWEERWNADHWTHIAFTWDAKKSTLQIYFNCTLIKTESGGGIAQRDDSDKILPLVLGASHGRAKFAHLEVDELAIWNKTLSRQTLCKIYHIRSGKHDHLLFD